MQPLQLFDTAFRRNEWLAERQSLISQNIANANTPGYKAKDVESFDDVMRKSLSMTTTDPMHLDPADGSGNVADDDSSNSEVLQSGNNVSLEQEFLKSADVSRNYSMNTQIIKAFSRMLATAIKA